MPRLYSVIAEILNQDPAVMTSVDRLHSNFSWIWQIVLTANHLRYLRCLRKTTEKINHYSGLDGACKLTIH